MALSAICSDCQGTYWLRVQTRFGPGAKRCPCYQEQLKTTRYEECGLPSRIANLTFDNFSAGDFFDERGKYDALTAAMTRARRFVDAFPICKRKGLLFHGGPATEMTHLAVATLKLLVDKGFSCLFSDYQVLLESFLQRSDPDTATSDASREFARRVMSVDVLLVDSLGSQRRSGWTTDTIGRIIKHRYYNERCLLATTALPLEAVPYGPSEGLMEMRTSVGAWQDSLGDRIGYDSVDRLLAHCEGISMAPTDLDQELEGNKSS